MYTPLSCHSDMSLLIGVSQPDQIGNRLEELGLNACAITDYGSVCHAVKFQTALKETKDDDGNLIRTTKKAILGNKFYVCNGNVSDQTQTNKKLNHQVILAKNYNGWKDLVELTSISNQPENFYYKPRIDYDLMKQFGSNNNLISFSGHLGSTLADAILVNGQLHSDWEKIGCRWANLLQDMFGHGNFFIEIQTIDQDKCPIIKTLAGALRDISKATGIPCVGTPNSHYTSKDRAIDQKVLLCRNMNTTFRKFRSHYDDDEFTRFFRSDNYHLPSFEEMLLVNTPEELDNSNLIASMCDVYVLGNKPLLPKLTSPSGDDENEYLRQLCREGWKKKVDGVIPKSEHAVYADRVKRELEVLQGAGLSSYFLILADVLRYMKEREWLAGPGRGSAAGCLVSYLTDITKVDPIKYKLLFERFYNAGRNTKDKISYPDIDTDVPIAKREQIVQYINNKYGNDKVSQIATYQTIKGRGAIRTVFNAYGNHSNQEINDITNLFPDEATIADDLNEMKEEDGESSIIRWVLQNEPEKLEAYCKLNHDGTLSGELALEIEQAIRLEKTKISQGKHPSGIVVCSEPLHKVCPMIFDPKTKKQILGFDMGDAEGAGLIKIDILGNQALDKLMTISELLEKGEGTYD